MMKTIKRVLSLLMVMVMLIGTLPLEALAASGSEKVSPFNAPNLPSTQAITGENEV